MKDFLSRIDKKYLYILGGILGAIILIIIILVIVKSCEGPSNDYQNAEAKMVSAAETYYANKKDEAPKEFESKEISASELAAAGYMKEMAKVLEDTSCVGKVTVYNYSGELLFIPDLKCTDYKTKHLADVIKKDQLIQVVSNTEETSNEETDPNADSNTSANTNNSNVVDPTSNDGTGRDYISGLYEENGEFVFKGKNPKNYISLNGFLFRIIDIDSNGLIRALFIQEERDSSYWDDKFNSDAKKGVGINEYKNSYLHNLTVAQFKEFKPKNKKHMAYNRLCVGKRYITELDISKEKDCELYLEHEYIMIPLASDFARASLDEHCTTVINSACTNYNYLTNYVMHSWTSNAVANNTYQAIVFLGGRATKEVLTEKYEYAVIITINGYEQYLGGNGTKAEPYIVGEAVEKKEE